MDEERITYVAERYDVSRRCAAALQLAELGYSHSGIASKLDVSTSTARGYINELQEKIDPAVVETLPKSRRFATFPSDGEPVEEPEYSGDYVTPDAGAERVRPLNRGVELSEIPNELINVEV